MLPPYVKPHLPIPDQLALLKARGMGVDDEVRAAHYLSHLGYYRLSGYWFPARQPGSDNFREGTSFDHAVDLYVFDKRLRLLLLDALEHIEVSVRVQAALLLSKADAHAHRNPKYLHGNFAKRLNPKTLRTDHASWLERLDASASRSRDDFVVRYGAKYSSPLPMWMAIELWDWGLLSHFVSGMRYADQTALAKIYSIPRPELLASWLRTLNHTRNVCAHHGRLWNRVSTDLPKPLNAGEVPSLAHLFIHGVQPNRVYASVAIAQYLLKMTSPQTNWANRLLRLIESFPTAPGFALSHAGFPANWRELALWH